MKRVSRVSLTGPSRLTTLKTAEQRASTTRVAAEHVLSVSLNVTGMTCAACSATVEKALLKVEGVKTASVSLMTCSSQIEYDDRLTSVPELIKAVVNSGYAAEPVAEDAAPKGPDHAAEAREWLCQFLGSLPFTLPVFLLSMVRRPPLISWPPRVSS